MRFLRIPHPLVRTALRYMLIQPNAFAIELSRMITTKIGQT